MRWTLLLGEALMGLRRNISMVISVILVTFVSLTFVGAAMLMQGQISTMQTFWSERAQVGVHMCSSVSKEEACIDGEATAEQIADVEASLSGEALSPLITGTRVESKEEAHKNLIEQLGEERASVLRPEQMGVTYWVTLKDPGQTQVIVEAFSGVGGVDKVRDQRAVLDPLFSALTVATYLAVGIAGLMLIAAVLLIGTTIRLSAYARRKEIGIMRLVGASNRFIQTPFVLEGVFAALIGSALASAAVVAGVHFGVEGYLRNRVAFIPTWVGVQELVVVIPVLIAIGVILSALSAGFAIRRWLRT